MHAHFSSQACTLRRSRLFKGAMTVFGIAFVFKVYIFVDFLKVQAGDVEEPGKLRLRLLTGGVPRSHSRGTTGGGRY